MAREHRALAAIIREHSGGKRVEPDDKLTLRTQVPGWTGRDLIGSERSKSPFFWIFLRLPLLVNYAQISFYWFQIHPPA